MQARDAGNATDRLDWPVELAQSESGEHPWLQAGSNICLDFHGDPCTAELVVFSDGNHHMALMDSLALFRDANPALGSIFYATTPPGPIVNMLRKGSLRMGNLVLSLRPHVFISPPNVLDRIVQEGFMAGHKAFVRNQGNVLLVRKGNPRGIVAVDDLARQDITLFLSNPETEKASYSAYHATLQALSQQGEAFPDDKAARGEVVYGERIHHREAPQAVAEGAADVAVVFYHLALRYLRIFPEVFDMVPLGGSIEQPEPMAGNVIGVTHVGLVEDGGKWGAKLLEFLESPQVLETYRRHGLLPATV